MTHNDEHGAMIARDSYVPDLDYDEDLEEEYHGPAELQGYHEIDEEEDYEDDAGYNGDTAESAQYIASDYTQSPPTP